MIGTADIVVRVFLYIMILTGIWLFLGRYILRFFKRENKKYRFGVKPTRRVDNKFKAHVRLLLLLTLGRKDENSIFYFLFLSIFLFFIFLSVFTGLFGISIFFVLMSMLAGFLPYIFLRFRLKSLQLQGSYEAVKLLSELTNMYKISSFNMSSAIDKTIGTIKDSPLSKKALFHLSLKVKEYKGKEELQSAIDDFVAAFDTEWATLLGMNIFESILNGTNVSVSLDDILSNLKQVKSSIEKDKRANYEAFTMVKFVIPVVYILSVFTAVKFFGFTIGRFFYYQFNTGLGIKLFITIVVLMVFSFCAMFVLSKPKFDY
ncbi:hypothetical protein ES703_103272 [subsurface metagenome]